MSDLAITIDLNTSARDAERAKLLLERLRDRFDIARFEFTKAVRIIPNEIPHSHPVLTVNTLPLDDAERFLSTYLLEQIHW